MLLNKRPPLGGSKFKGSRICGPRVLVIAFYRPPGNKFLGSEACLFLGSQAILVLLD